MTSDIDKARQILVNLLGNAVKFTDAGAVTLRLAQGGARPVRIDIEDTGIGIPADELPRLFRPFAQVDTGLTRRHGGTGLGLYISRRLATLLGGHIEVASEPGVGSTFSVVLPLSGTGRPDADARRAQLPRRAPSRFRFMYEHLPSDDHRLQRRLHRRDVRGLPS